MTETTEIKNMPRHVAIVPDGNRRWAEERGKSIFEGHRAGVKAIQKAVQFALKKKLEVLTVWVYSTENLKRPKPELDYLMHLSRIGLRGAARALKKSQVQVRFIGDVTSLPGKVVQAMKKLEALTKDYSGLKLIIAAGYGGRWDITTAVRNIAKRVVEKELSPASIDEALISNHLSMAGLPDPDLVIRTGGSENHRISNFCLWNLAYSELYFPNIYWPAFDDQAFQDALIHYSTRKRRFGVRPK